MTESDAYIELIDKAKKFLSYHSKYNSYDIYPDDIKSIEGVTVNSIEAVKEKSDNTYTVTENNAGTKAKKPKLSVLELCDEEWTKAKTLKEMKVLMEDCMKCHLYRTRTKIVFGEGNPNAKLVVVGEAPGESEDLQGMPFVGRAGQLLTKILEAINFKREEIFICNILKSRPPSNRNPEPEEIEACIPYLHKQLDLIKPEFILALGTFASQSLLNTKEPLGKLRGKFHDYRGIKLMVTYHPAALLRNPNWKKPTWEDVQLLRKEYDKAVK